MTKTMKYYILSEHASNVGVEYVADTEHEANHEKAHLELFFPAGIFWIEYSAFEPTCVTL